MLLHPKNKKEALEEYNKLKNDPVYFIRNYVKVVHPIRGVVPFDLYKFQEGIIDELQHHRFNIIRKFRQAGITTISCAYSLWNILFKDNFSILVVSIGDRESQDFLKRVKEMYFALPKWLRLKYSTLNKHELIIAKTKSSIKAVPSASSAGRGLSMSLLIVDEAAFIDGMSEFWAAILPTLSCVTRDTLVLTPTGYRRIDTYFSDDKKPGDYFNIPNEKVFGKNGLETLSHGYVSPPGKTKIIKTNRGLTLEVTCDHPLYKLSKNKGKMTPSKNLKVGDFLRVQHSMNCYGNKTLPTDLAYMLGGYIAEGWTAKEDTIYISNTNDDFREVYLRNGYKPVKSRPDKLYLSSRKIVKDFKSFGINPRWKCDTKQIPEIIFKCTKEEQGNFIRGMFDGDGCCCLTGATCYNSTSSKLVKELQLLLLNMGIITQIHTLSGKKALKRYEGRLLPQGKPLLSCKDSYCLVIPRSQHSKFRDLIGFNIKYKKNNLDIKCDKYSQDDRKQKTIPLKHIGKKLQKIIKSTKKSLSKFRKENKIRLDKIFYPDYKKRFITVNLLYRFKDILQNEFPDLLKNHENFFNEFCSNHIWDNIVSIEDSFADTVDFTVPKTHSFLQNGILGSNTGGQAFLISTVNGVGNFYYDKWFGAVEGKNEFNPIQIHYKQHPEYASDEWEKSMKSGMSPKQWAQEFLCDFLMTGDTFIDSDVLSRLRDNIQKDFYTKYNNRLRVFNEPHDHHDYLMAVDPSLGRGRDYSAFHIIDLYNGEQVAEFYSNKIPLNMFADHIVAEAYNYNTAYVVCERNGIGRALIDSLYYVSQYENLWMDENDFGVQVTNHNRDNILGCLEQALREGWFRIRSERCVDELMSFIIDEKTGKVEAGEGCHDDLVLSLAIGAYTLNKLGSNVPLFVNNDIITDDKYQVVSPVIAKQMSSPIVPGTTETVEDYHKWLNS